MRKLKQYAWIAVIVFSCYMVAACIRYAFAHPELTDTQRVLHLIDALLWR